MTRLRDFAAPGVVPAARGLLVALAFFLSSLAARFCSWSAPSSASFLSSLAFAFS